MPLSRSKNQHCIHNCPIEEWCFASPKKTNEGCLSPVTNSFSTTLNKRKNERAREPERERAETQRERETQRARERDRE